MIEKAVRVPRLALLTAWEWEGLGEPHPVLGTNNYYMTDEFRADLQRRTHETLTRLGLASDGVLTPRFRTTLTTLARADRQYYSWTNFPRRSDDDGAILVAALGRDAVRLITDDTVVQLDPVSTDGLPGHFLDALPAAPAAGLRPMWVPKATFDGVDDGSQARPLVDNSARNSDLMRLRELMRADRDAVHQIYAAKRDPSGNRVRSLPLSAIDLTGQGRILTYVNDDGDGLQQINVFPGNRRNMLSTLDATIDGL
ncbi:MAG: secretion-associated protein EspG [Amycolatopsis sp.]|nr:secretion-associated protein EspG [Amycolatopsis sp.]